MRHPLVRGPGLNSARKLALQGCQAPLARPRLIEHPPRAFQGRRPGVGGAVRLRCASCPYAYDVVDGVKQRVDARKKTVDDVLGGDDAWRNVDKTSATCPGCAHDEAYFMQIQIRSADEPMSVFYKCVKCARQWREG